MQNIQNLLNQVKIINQKNNEILDATGARFNMFKVCGVNHYENTHSAILAEFLNPQSSHGLKHEFLQTFLEVLGVKIPFNVEKAKVIREKYAPTSKENTEDLKKGFIDIFIEDDEKNVIIIENKFRHGDEPEQLKRYDNFAKSYAKNYQIFYLTLFGSEASEQSGEGVNYTPISHAKNIIEWLEKCLSFTTRYPIVRETIVQYINHLKTLTNQDMDRKNQEEVTELLAKDLKAAHSIYQNYQTTFDFIAKKYFNPKMEKFAKEKGLEYSCRDIKETHIDFWLQGEKWENYWIQFAKDHRGYFYGLKNYKDTISPENIEKFHKNFNLNITNSTNSEWIFWEYLPETLTIKKWQEDIINSNKFFEDCKTRIENILTAMEGIDF